MNRGRFVIFFWIIGSLSKKLIIVINYHNLTASDPLLDMDNLDRFFEATETELSFCRPDDDNYSKSGILGLLFFAGIILLVISIITL